MEEKIIRRHYLFSGRVQGVGFRFRAQWEAQKLGITGWVMNRADGRVEMVAQGTPLALARLIHQMRQSDWIFIESVEEWPEEVKPEETDFRIHSGRY